MLIHEKLAPGSRYPQIKHLPLNYIDFLAAFRGGHTLDDNLTATAIANTPQAAMLKTGIESGHLTRKANPIQGESLIDIFLTDEGAEQVLTPQDKQYCKVAVDLSRNSVAEKDGELHPYVGAVVVRDGQILATGYRGETGDGRHAEYCAFRKLNDDVDHIDLSECTVYTTLEPCSIRKPGKTPCADRLINGKVARVVYGMADKDETVYGHSSLSEAGVEIGLFPNDLIRELLVLNKPWSDTRRKPEVMPPSNGSSPLSSAEYYKPGTSVADKVRLFVRPPKGEAGLYTIENSDNRVLAFGRTLEEIAVKWRQIDSQKVIVEKMQRVGSFNTDQRLALI